MTASRRGDHTRRRRSGRSFPHGRLQRIRELIATGPPLDVDKVAAVDAAERDPPDRAAQAGATGERHRGHRRAAPLELGPHVAAADQLEAADSQPGGHAAWNASRPEGVRHGSPGCALHVGVVAPATPA